MRCALPKDVLILDNSFTVLMATMGLETGGAETHIIELAKGLNAYGVKVIIASNGGVYEKELDALNITHVKAPLHNKRIKNVISAYYTLKRIIQENDVRLVHAHARIPAFLCGLLQKRLKFRLVTTVHFNFANRFPYNLLTNWGEKTLAVSHDLKEYLISNYNTPQENIFLTVNGIDTDRFSPDNSAGAFLNEIDVSKDAVKILCVTRMDKEPSGILYTLIETAAELYERHNNLKVIIVGTGSVFNDVKKAADAMNKRLSAKVIILTGARTDIPNILPCADVFVGISRAALEAMAACKPVILAGGYGYIGRFDQNVAEVALATNFTCRGFNYAEKVQLACDIEALLNENDGKKAALGAYGRDVVKKHYSIEKMCKDALAVYESARKPKRAFDVCLFGYYGSGNNGDDALLKSIIDDLREAKPDIKITVLSRKPSETAKIYGVNSIYLFDFIKIKKRLKDTNLLISGGGTLLQDITSTRSLLYYLSVIQWAHKSGCKIMLYANGIGPVRLEKNKRRIKNALSLVDCITLRDEPSFELLKELDVKNVPARLAADVAFSLKFSSPSFYIEKKYFVAALRRWRYTGAGFEKTAARFCDYMNETYGTTTIFLPMQPSEDIKISKKIIANMKTKGELITSISTDDILTLIKGAQFVFSMRLHTIIYAAMAAVPSIAIVYDPKVKAMMDITGQTFYMDARDVNFDALSGFGNSLMENRENISKQIGDIAEKQKELAKISVSLAAELLDRNDF